MLKRQLQLPSYKYVSRTSISKFKATCTLYLALGLHQTGLKETSIVEVAIDGNTRRVIATVLEARQAIEENIADLLALLGDQMV